MSQLDDLMTFTQAAKRVGMRRQRLEHLCLAAGICVLWGARIVKTPDGGKVSAPTYRVKLSEVERLILGRRNAVPKTARTPRPRTLPGRLTSSGQPLHPDVRC